MRNGFAALFICLLAGSPVRAQSPPNPYANPFPPEPQPPAAALMWLPDDDPLPHGPGPGDIDQTPHGHCVYGDVAFMLAWVKNRNAPPLLTSGPNLLLHNLDFDDQQRVGGRFLLGAWLDSDQKIGVEAGYFFLGDRSPVLGVGSPGLMPLAVPFTNAQGAPASFAVSQPGQFAGSVLYEAPSRFWGAEAGLRKEVFANVHGYVDVLAGFRFLELDEGLHFTASRVALPGGPLAPGSVQAVSDRFGTRNQFYGGYLGAHGELRWQNLFLNGYGRVGLGSVDETANVNGTTLAVSPQGTRLAVPGGLFAGPGNSGRFEHTEFAAVPEVGVNVGYRLAAQLRLTLGYSLIYMDHAARPGDQMDRAAFLFRQSDFWMQSLNFGVEFRY
jgi:hypothetical protein